MKMPFLLWFLPILFIAPTLLLLASTVVLYPNVEIFVDFSDFFRKVLEVQRLSIESTVVCVVAVVLLYVSRLSGNMRIFLAVVVLLFHLAASSYLVMARSF